jgi:hypothetical protein
MFNVHCSIASCHFRGSWLRDLAVFHVAGLPVRDGCAKRHSKMTNEHRTVQCSGQLPVVIFVEAGCAI